MPTVSSVIHMGWCWVVQLTLLCVFFYYNVSEQWAIFQKIFFFFQIFWALLIAFLAFLLYLCLPLTILWNEEKHKFCCCFFYLDSFMILDDDWVLHLVKFLCVCFFNLPWAFIFDQFVTTSCLCFAFFPLQEDVSCHESEDRRSGPSPAVLHRHGHRACGQQEIQVSEYHRSPFLLRKCIHARQLDRSVLSNEISPIHLANLQQEGFSKGLRIRLAISFLIVLTKPGSNCSLLPLKPQKKMLKRKYRKWVQA